MVFHWSLSDCKSPQVSKTLLNIMAVLRIILWSAGTAKSTILQVLFFFFFFLLIIIRSGLLAEIRWSECMSKSHRSLCVLFSRTGAGLGIYHLFVWSNLNFLHLSQWITLPTQSCLVLYSFCANLLYSLIMWLMIQLCHRITYICYFVASYLFLLWYDWFLRRCFVLLLVEILFLS